jgi:nicotinamidase-related amidase
MADNTALLVIDVQEGVTGLGGRFDFGYERSGDFIANMNRLVGHAREAGWETCYVAEVTHWYLAVPAFMTHFAFMKGSEGAKLDSRLEVVTDNYFEKVRASAFTNKKLVRFLEDKEIERVVVCGLAADGCAGATAKSAIVKGYRVTVASDACMAQTDAKARGAFEGLESIGVRIASTTGILTAPVTPMPHGL